MMLHFSFRLNVQVKSCNVLNDNIIKTAEKVKKASKAEKRNAH